MSGGIISGGGGTTLYAQATEPTDWSDDDLWLDTDDNLLYVNVSGTATSIAVAGVASQGDVVALG